MTALIDLTVGWKELNGQPIINRLNGEMGYFPLCCSTGILKAVNAGRLEELHAKVLSGKEPYRYTLPSKEKILAAKTIWELMRLVKANPYFAFPEEVGTWYCMSLCLKKTATGKDDSGDSAYGNYKSNTIAMFDRLLEDKSDPQFKFSYNTIYSVDHFQQWLSEQGGVYGDFYMNPARPGGHGARVRGSLFSPEIKPLKKYEKERIELLRNHMVYIWDILKEAIPKKDQKAAVTKSQSNKTEEEEILW